MTISKKWYSIFILSGGLLWGWPTVALPASGLTALGATAHRTWSWDLTTGLDSFLHTYALATDDTTEAVTEFLVQGAIAGRSPWRARHRWRVRAEASSGTELFRERFAGDYRFLGADNIDRVRLTGSLWGRQYRDSSEYSQSSDSWEGRLEARAAPLVGRGAKLELRGWHGRVNYDEPSTLEVDYRDSGGGVFVRSTGLGQTLWGLGTRAGQRAYPDSTEIDRELWSVEGDLDHHDLTGQGLRVFHKSERRLIRNEIMRPSAWTHWSDFSGLLAHGDGYLFLDFQAEVWRYDQVSEIYFNSTRVEGAGGYRWGNLMSATWKLGLAGERLAAGESPESYSQYGVRGGVESYGAAVGGSLTLECGRRVYTLSEQEVDLDVQDLSSLETFAYFSDFSYWKIWLMGSWRINPQFELDVMANYEPESHTETDDDSALGFASLRLRWRP